jgi:signal transduction histidine kinase
MGVPLRVLIVEDSRDDADLVLLELQRGGYEPICERVDTQNGLLAALNKQTWDAIIADYSMPGFSGISAFSMIREMKLDIPFIIVSGTIGEDIAVSAMKVGVHDYVMKNNLSRLVPAVEREMREAKNRQNRKLAEEKLRVYQKKLRSLASQLSLTEEQERRRIAVELHDQIGQSLVFLKMKLKSMREAADSELSQKQLDEICDIIDQIIQDTRTLTFDLSSPILYEMGFEAALSDWLTDHIEKQHGIKVHFEDDGQPKPLNDDVRVLLFKVVRELLINVVKHAQAREVKVSTLREDDHILITVEDDGVGFSYADSPAYGKEKGGFGLFSIRERLDHLGGKFTIESEPGKGTHVTLTVPLGQK